jgi:catechol 2,3-dioxygenase
MTGEQVSGHDDSGVLAAGIRASHPLPPATSAGQVSLQVSQLARSVHFYETMLGFRTVESSASRALLGGADRTPLLALHAGETVTAAHRGSLGLYHFAVLLPDRGALARLIRHLAGRGVRPGASDHLVSEAIYLHDPDGLGIEVYADRPRAQWSTRGGELAMATDPLDIASLLAAAGPAPWDVLPAGTTIGHVHLHVGDLQHARAFYHEQLGLDITVSHYPGALFLSAGGYHHHLGVNTWAGPQATPPPPSAARLLRWQLVVPGADAARAAATRLAAAGNTVTELVPDALWEVQDPWRTALHIRVAG